MAEIRQTPGGDDAPVESRRAARSEVDPARPAVPDDQEPPAAEQLEFGELAAESARPTPLDDIAEAEREQMPRD